MGSIISPRHLERIEGMLQRRRNSSILAGGTRMVEKSALDEFDFSKGSFLPPTVIADVNVEDELWQEEVFGPVVVVKGFSVGFLSQTQSGL
jgi:acyl-CoA reductase-like NAD-dependent aldehyde dehydrogenase